MRRLLAGRLNEAGYRRLLIRQRELFREWEAERADWLAGVEAVTGWRYVSREDALGRDLDARGSAVDAAPLAAISTHAAPTRPGAPWGELYVIEGSALGGRVIVRQLREQFPHLAHHFYAIGEHATPPWHRFQSILDHALADDAARKAAVDAALAMFARFQQTLQDDSRHV